MPPKSPARYECRLESWTISGNLDEDVQADDQSDRRRQRVVPWNARARVVLNRESEEKSRTRVKAEKEPDVLLMKNLPIEALRHIEQEEHAEHRDRDQKSMRLPDRQSPLNSRERTFSSDFQELSHRI